MHRVGPVGMDHPKFRSFSHMLVTLSTKMTHTSDITDAYTCTLLKLATISNVVSAVCLRY